MTREEFDELFRKDENDCYVNLIIPATNEFPEMNLIGKNPNDYTLDEIIHLKTYRRVMLKYVDESSGQ